MKQPNTEAVTHLRNRIHIIIEGTDTRLGKLFDIVLLIAILASVAVVMLDSVLYMRLQYGTLFLYAEWFFTILFTIEYMLRLFSAPNRFRYVFSFFGIVDLLSVLPSYLSLMFVGVQYLLVIRILRILRIFRVLKLEAYMQQAGFLASALRTSQQKIIAVPTGIFTSELARNMRPQLNPVTCPNCGKFGHAVGADFCDRCGHALHV